MRVQLGKVNMLYWISSVKRSGDRSDETYVIEAITLASNCWQIDPEAEELELKVNPLATVCYRRISFTLAENKKWDVIALSGDKEQVKDQVKEDNGKLDNLISKCLPPLYKWVSKNRKEVLKEKEIEFRPIPSKFKKWKKSNQVLYILQYMMELSKAILVEKKNRFVLKSNTVEWFMLRKSSAESKWAQIKALELTVNDDLVDKMWTEHYDLSGVDFLAQAYRGAGTFGGFHFRIAGRLMQHGSKGQEDVHIDVEMEGEMLVADLYYYTGKKFIDHMGSNAVLKPPAKLKMLPAKTYGGVGLVDTVMTSLTSDVVTARKVATLVPDPEREENPEAVGLLYHFFAALGGLYELEAPVIADGAAEFYMFHDLQAMECTSKDDKLHYKFTGIGVFRYTGSAEYVHSEYAQTTLLVIKAEDTYTAKVTDHESILFERAPISMKTKSSVTTEMHALIESVAHVLKNREMCFVDSSEEEVCSGVNPELADMQLLKVSEVSPMMTDFKTHKLKSGSLLTWEPNAEKQTMRRVSV